MINDFKTKENTRLYQLRVKLKLFCYNYYNKIVLYSRPGIYGIKQIKFCFTQSQTTGAVSPISMQKLGWLAIHCCTVSCDVGILWLGKKNRPPSIREIGQKQCDTVTLL